MTKRVSYPQGIWGLFARSWELSLRADNKSENTIYAYIQAVRLLGEWAHRQQPVIEPTDVRPIQIRLFIAELINRTSAGNAHTNYRALRTFFNWLVDEGEIDRTPMDRTKAPIVPEKPIPVITDISIKTLFVSCQGKDFTSQRDTAIIRVLFDTGARLSEVANLTVDDVDHDTRLIHVFGKGRRSRAIPFGPKTGLALLRYLRARSQRADAESPHLWLGLRGHLTDEGIKQMLKRRGELAGVPNLHAHRFRHTLAHAWQLNAGNETDLMRIMGWKSREMLGRYGASAADQRAHASARALHLGDRV
ncbi:MAG TPA: tyrosine-type recombinase/integrase [Pseudonocardiaceae bacterium]|jgi:site-specific recombinase XerD|nr:tyrosine-type recombinase/integrase [Pseudonocardiaceae bacterium]